MLPRVWTLIMVGLLILTATGCVDTGNIKDAVNAIVPKIDTVITAVNTNSASWQSLLQQLMVDINGLEGKFTKDAQATVRLASSQINATLQNASGAAGAEINCQADILQAKLRLWIVQQLEYVKSVLLHKADANAPEKVLALPYICNIVPDSLDMDPVQRQNTIILWGNDLSSSDLKVFLRYGNNTETEFQANLISHPSNYKLTLNTSPVDNTLLCNKDRRQIVIRSNGQEIGTLGVNSAACKFPTPPAPSPEKVKWDQISFFNMLGAGTPNQFISPPVIVAGACSPGYQRSRYTSVTLSQSTVGGYCQMAWTTYNDINNCQVKVTPYFPGSPSNVLCQITVYEVGIPAPAPPACDCW